MNDQLLTVAEIAVTLAGFSALVALLGSHRSRRDPRVDVLFLRVMLEASFFVAALSLFPLVPFGFGIDAEAVWRISAAAFLLFGVPLSLYGQRRAQRMSALFDLTGRSVRDVATCLDVIAYLLVCVVIAGLAHGRAGGFYFAALYANLIMAGLLFIGFAASTFMPPSDQDRRPTSR